MRKIILLALSLSFLFILSACGPGQVFGPTFTPTPTHTLTPTITPTFTSTFTPTLTSTSTSTRTPTPPPQNSIPSEKPLSKWQGLPIMPGALNGEETVPSRTYYFTTHASQDEVKDYYLETLPQYGWVTDLILPNDEGGYIMYRDCCLDFLYIYEADSLTHVYIWYKGP